MTDIEAGEARLDEVLPLPPYIFKDILPLLSTALGELSSGQLIKSDKLDLLDLMGAIEIMDVRTDSFLPPLTEEKGLPTFDPSLNFPDPVELVWLLDEILRLEVGFHQGHPLASTLFTCQYFRPHSLSAVSARSTTSKREDLAEGLRNVVLRAMLMGIIKSTEITWEELCKGQVYENEDVLLSSANLNFPSLLSACFPISALQMPSTEVVSLLAREVSVDDVLGSLEDALEWVNERVQNVVLRAALVDRLTLRVHLVYTLAFLSSPQHTSPASLAPHLGFASTLIQKLADAPSIAYTPSPQLRATLVRNCQMPLAIKQPVRIIEMNGLAETWGKLSSWWRCIGEGVEMWDDWNKSGAGWDGIRDYVQSVSRVEMDPYPRSLHASIISSSPGVLFGAVSAHSISLSASFFSSSLAIPSYFWVDLCSPPTSASSSTLFVKSSTGSGIGPELISWLEGGSTALLQTLNMGLQNRPRGRRWGCKSIDNWVNWIEETIRLVPMITSISQSSPSYRSRISLLPVALSTHLLSQILETLLCGFESRVGLYATGEERLSIWWICERVARDLVTNLEQTARLSLEVGHSTRRRKLKDVEEVEIIAMFCQASRLMANQFAPKNKQTPSFASPFFNSSVFAISNIVASIDANSRRRSRFERRFRWLRGKICVVEGKGADQLIQSKLLEDIADWNEYEAASAQLEPEIGSIESRSECREVYRNITTILRAQGDRFEENRTETGSQGKGQDWNEGLLNTALANEAFLDSLSVSSSTSSLASVHLEIRKLKIKDVGDAIGGRKLLYSEWFPVYSLQ